MAKIGMVTTWGDRCGVAEYTKFLLDATGGSAHSWIVLAERAPGASDLGYDVERCWSRDAADLQGVVATARSRQLDVVHFQHQWSFFPDAHRFASVLSQLRGLGVGTVVTFHATTDYDSGDATASLGDIAGELALAAAIWVHSGADVERLARFGLEANVKRIPHGSVEFADEDPAKVRRILGIPHRPVVGTFGFLLPHKGVLETIKAVEMLLPRYPAMLFLAVCSIHPDPSSALHLRECLEYVHGNGLERNVTVLGRYLSEAEIVTLLHAADLCVLPYQRTGESASGALRFALSSNRPVITTRQAIFEDEADALHQIDEPTPEGIARAIEDVLGDPALRSRLGEATRAFVAETSWPAIARRYYSLLDEVLAGR